MIDLPMSDLAQAATTSSDVIPSALKSQETRLARLEEDATHKTLLKRLTAIASASALFLGLILTFVSLHDAFVTKPEADRIARLSQFNQAVNSVAKEQQEEAQLGMKFSDRGFQLAMRNAITPRILVDLSTASALLRDLDGRDVGIPQLLTLTGAASLAGDSASEKDFVTRAAKITNASPYLRSESKRYEGIYWFSDGDFGKGRALFKNGIESSRICPGDSVESCV